MDLLRFQVMDKWTSRITGVGHMDKSHQRGGANGRAASETGTNGQAVSWGQGKCRALFFMFECGDMIMNQQRTICMRLKDCNNVDLRPNKVVVKLLLLHFYVWFYVYGPAATRVIQ